MNTRLLCILLALAATTSVGAEGPVFVTRETNGHETTGPLVKLADWSLDPGKSRAARLGTTAWLGLRQVGAIMPELPGDEHLISGNGDRVPMRELRLEDEKLFFRHKDLGGDKEVSMPLSGAAVIWRIAPDGTASPEELRRRLLRASRPRDVVMLRNGDVIEGTLQAIRGGQVEVEVNKKVVTARWPQVAAVALSSELVDRARPKGPQARVVLAAGDGSPGGRLTLTQATSDGKTLEGKTAFGAELSVPLTRVLALERGGDDVVELSDLEPAEYVYSPYLDEKWAWSRDAAVTGRDLRLGGSAYSRGIGMHAASRLRYALGGAYRRFDALVGLDDRDGKKGRVKLVVLVDGKPGDLSSKETWTHADGPLRVNVDVQGAKELTLEVRNAGDGPVQAVVNWVNPRLVK